MVSLATRVRQTTLSGIVRAFAAFRSNRLYLCLLVPAVALGLARAPTAEPSAPSTKAAIEYFQQKAAKREIWRVEVYYHNWGSFTGPLPEEVIRESAWTYQSIVRIPVVTPLAPELAKIADELATMKLEPVKVPVRDKDFRLVCVVLFGKDEKPFLLSFARYPLSVYVNGEGFKPSWKLFLGVSQFLPGPAGPELLASVREDWVNSGYPKIPEDGEVDEPSQRVKQMMSR